MTSVYSFSTRNLISVGCQRVALAAIALAVALFAGALQAADTNTAQRALVIASKPLVNEGLAQESDLWLRCLRASGLQVRMVQQSELEEHLNEAQILVLPDTRELSISQRDAIIEFMRSGRSLILTGLAGQRVRESTDTPLAEMLRLRYRPLTVEEGDSTWIVLDKPGRLSASMPRMQRMSLQLKHPVTLNSQHQAIAFWLIGAGAKPDYEAAAHNTAIVADAYGAGRFVWFGFPLDSLGGDLDSSEAFARLLHNSLAYLGNRATLEISPWPDSYEKAILYSMDVEERFGNMKFVNEIEGLDAITYFILTRSAALHENLLREVADSPLGSDTPLTDTASEGTTLPDSPQQLANQKQSDNSQQLDSSQQPDSSQQLASQKQSDSSNRPDSPQQLASSQQSSSPQQLASQNQPDNSKQPDSQHQDRQVRVTALGEIAVHGDNHDVFRGQTKERQLQRLTQARDYITKTIGIAPIGFRPPEEAYDFFTIEAMAEAGFTYLLGNNNPDRAVPRMLRVANGQLVQFTILNKDDVNLITQASSPEPDVVLDHYLRDIDMIFNRGGLYVVNFHSQILAVRRYLPVLADMVKYVDKQNAWVTNGRDLYYWWMERNAVRLRVSDDTSGHLRLSLHNTAETPTDRINLNIWLPEDYRNLRIESPAGGRRVLDYNTDGNKLTLRVPYLRSDENIEFSIRWQN